MKRNALITGGTRGIGSSISKILKSSGFNVVATYLNNHNHAEKFSKENDIDVVCLDSSDWKAVEKELPIIFDKYGKFDTLINNSGITDDSFLHKMTFEQWNRVILNNLTSCFVMSRWMVPEMRKSNFGRIINMSSINAQKGQKGQSNYCAAKAGILGLTKSLAQEVASCGITVNAIAPGYIDTEMVQNVPSGILDKIKKEIPLGRLGTTEEIASVVKWLSDKDSSFVTGMTFSINGGHYMS
jgi:acetoacetyl-CoA reductase